MIVRYTNQYIDIITSNFSSEKGMKPTDLIELKAFFVLLYLVQAYT